MVRFTEPLAPIWLLGAICRRMQDRVCEGDQRIQAARTIHNSSKKLRSINRKRPRLAKV